MKINTILSICVLEFLTAACWAGQMPPEETVPGYTIVAGTSPADTGPDIEQMFREGERFEAEKEYLAAYYLYDDILARFPGSGRAENLKYRALRNLGAASLALEKLAEAKERPDPDIYYGLLGDEAMYQIRWGEKDRALALLDGNARLASTEKPVDIRSRGSLESFGLRTWCDRAAALKQKNEMESIVRAYEQRTGTSACAAASFLQTLPAWTIGDIADAYAFRERPETALSLCSTATVTENDPGFSGIALSRYQILRQLGRFEESGALLDRLDAVTPAQIVERGVLRDNWLKEELACERGWWLICQDRFDDARRYLATLTGRAPFNSHMRTLLAHLYLWEGSPRKALEEFEISRTMDPRSNANEIGYCLALDENGRGEEARSLARRLSAMYPGDRDVGGMRRRFAVRDMRSLSFGARSTTGYPDAAGMQFSLAFRQPVLPGRSIDAEFITQDTAEEGMRDTRQRGRLGIDWRFGRDVRAGAAVSGSTAGGDYGWAASFELVPRDQFAFSGSYDSFSMDVPLAARLQGVRADEFAVAAGYRPVEGLRCETGFRTLRLSDGNDETTCALDLDKTLHAGAYWKTRLGIEGGLLMHSRQDTGYFSPGKMLSAYLVPGVEHVWLKRVERSFSSALYAGLGGQWQDGYSGQTAWFARLQQEFAFSDTMSVLLNGDLNDGFYDGREQNTWNLEIMLGQRF